MSTQKIRPVGPLPRKQVRAYQLKHRLFFDQGVVGAQVWAHVIGQITYWKRRAEASETAHNKCKSAKKPDDPKSKPMPLWEVGVVVVVIVVLGFMLSGIHA